MKQLLGTIILISILEFRINAEVLAQVHADVPAERQVSAEASSNWKWKTDLRLRTQQETTAPADSRLSEKLRARIDVKVDVESDLKAEFRLATTKTNNSGNQTLGDNKDPGFTRRDFGLDLAFGEWKPLPFFKAVVGRIPQVHFRPGDSQILLDVDLALEGAALVMDHSYDEHISIFANGGSTLLRENYDTYYSEKLTDNMINWGQAGLAFKTQDSVTTVGGGFFNYTALQDMKFSDVSTGGSARGNSEGNPGIYKNSYVPRQYFLETKIKWNAYQIGAFAERIVNGETTDPNQASWTGFSVVKDKWKMQLAYAYIASDAVPGIFTDSDFAGNTTNSSGYVFTASLKLKKFFTLGLTQYLNKKKFGLDDAQYSRTHLDIAFEFSM